jgi:HEPN domain-containing protein
MKYFSPMPETLEELKKTYRKLSLTHHPDIGGSDEIMKIINDEYTELFGILKDIHRNASGEIYRWEINETPEELIELTSQLAKAQKWIDSAEDDLASAEYIAQVMDRSTFKTLWHHCRSAAEKYLKALIVVKLKVPPKMKDLLKLLEICEESAKINMTYIYRECERLMDYDTHKHQFDDGEVKETAASQALKDVDKIRYFVTSYLEEIWIMGSTIEMKALKI